LNVGEDYLVTHTVNAHARWKIIDLPASAP
jgi:hypothetical protein